MTFDDMVQQVITKTNRPDMTYLSSGGSGEIPQAIQAATLLLHTYEANFFTKDFQESAVTFLVPAQYTQSIDTTTMTRFRAVNYIRKTDQNVYTNNGLLPPLQNMAADRTKAFLDIVDATDWFDPVYGLERQDIAWQAGDTLNLKSSSPLSTCMMGWYQFPNIGTLANNYTDYVSWIARDFPFAIIYAATSSIYSDTGQQDQSRKLDAQDGLATTHRNALIKNSIITKGW